MAKRRAFADEYAIRLNRAVALLDERSSAEAVRALAVEHGLSERQARRYVRAAERCPDGVLVPERTAAFTVRLAPSLIAALRERAGAGGQTLSAVTAEAVRGYLAGAGERGGGQAR